MPTSTIPEKKRDKRTNIYVFNSLSELRGYFKGFLSGYQIDAVVHEARTRFIVRQGVAPQETELQFIRKCEVMLMHFLKTGEISGTPAGQ